MVTGGALRTENQGGSVWAVRREGILRAFRRRRRSWMANRPGDPRVISSRHARGTANGGAPGGRAWSNRRWYAQRPSLPTSGFRRSGHSGGVAGHAMRGRTARYPAWIDYRGRGMSSGVRRLARGGAAGSVGASRNEVESRTVSSVSRRIATGSPDSISPWMRRTSRSVASTP